MSSREAHRREAEVAPKEAAQVAHKALRGAAWAVGLGWGSRLLSLFGTLALTFFLDRQSLGEVTSAAILIGTANQLSGLAVPSYLATRQTLGETTRWTAVATYAALGLFSLLAVALAAAPLGQLVGAPKLAVYAMPLAAGAYLTRMSAIPEVLLQRDLQFRTVSVYRAVADVSYSVCSLALAAYGFGGHAVAWGNVVRGTVALSLFSIGMAPTKWAFPSIFSRAELRKILSFGVPLTFGMAGNVVARQWDNWLILGQFGASTAGAYNQAYNLADVPASQVTEQVGDIVAPSFAKLDLNQKKQAIVRILGAVALFVLPLSAGLSLVAPTFVALLRPEWASMAQLLSILALFALFRPLGWTLSVYFQTTDRTRTVMFLMILLIVVLFTSMTLLGRSFGPAGASLGVVVAFFVHAMGSVIAAARDEGLSLGRLLVRPARALLACGPLALLVLAGRAGATHIGIAAGPLRLLVEVLAGALGYALGLRVFAWGDVRDLLALVRATRRARS